MNTLQLTSKFPNQSSIFAEMSRLAAECEAINLSQGFPNFEVAPELIDAVTKYMKAGYNQYALYYGMPQLREQIAHKCERMIGYKPDSESNITVTTGATEALFCAITAVVHTGDEVIVFEPAYDSYSPVIRLSGGNPIPIALKFPNYHIDWDEVKKKVTQRTKLIIINTPHNPTGSKLKPEDFEALSRIVTGRDILVLSDEVYEHMVFDDQEHESVLHYPELREQSFAVFSFGKTFHATGWKTGYCIAPAYLTKELRKVHQHTVFSTSTPMQLAIAEYMSNPENYLNLYTYYQNKRDLFLDLMKDTKFKPLACQGTYFQLMSYADISDEPDTEFAKWLTQEHGVATIPISVFYGSKEDNKVVRFCFAKTDHTLQAAAERLNAI
ncbi:MAG: methionine aminotransferase [Flammeovirgaceae bacterium]